MSKTQIYIRLKGNWLKVYAKFPTVCERISHIFKIHQAFNCVKLRDVISPSPSQPRVGFEGNRRRYSMWQGTQRNTFKIACEKMETMGELCNCQGSVETVSKQRQKDAIVPLTSKASLLPNTIFWEWQNKIKLLFQAGLDGNRALSFWKVKGCNILCGSSEFSV